MKKHASPKDIEHRLAAALGKLRSKSSVVLAKVESKSTPGTFHEIRLGSANNVFCDCNGFKYRQSCDHMARWRDVLVNGSPVTVVGLRRGR